MSDTRSPRRRGLPAAPGSTGSEPLQREFVDQLGDRVRVTFPPRRIVSLVPSQTELLFDLGLDDEIVGVTRYCVRPEEGVAGKARVGGTKRFRFDVIDGLRPDLIIGAREENYLEGIRRLRTRYPVWMSDVGSLDDALGMIRGVGDLVDRGTEAERLADGIAAGFAELDPTPRRRAAYLIWKEPFMAAARGTFIDAMMRACGLVNVLGERRRYPEVELENVEDAEVILLSSEPYPFTEADVAFVQEGRPGSRVLLVDGAMFSWYGSRLRHAPGYFRLLREKLDAGAADAGPPGPASGSRPKPTT